VASKSRKATQKPASKGRGEKLAYGRPARKYTSKEISLAGIQPDFSRADLHFDGVDHAGASYEARIFLNNTGADASTPKKLELGYAGSFHIFGHGGCYGDDEGHCEVRTRRPYDPRPEHPLTPARKIVIATDAVRRALKKGKNVTVTVVPIVVSGTPKCDYENVLGFNSIRVLTYR
jgi:hypothetical protein